MASRWMSALRDCRSASAVVRAQAACSSSMAGLQYQPNTGIVATAVHALVDRRGEQVGENPAGVKEVPAAFLHRLLVGPLRHHGLQSMACNSTLRGSVAEKCEMTVRQANWCQCSRWESGRREKASHHLHPVMGRHP